MTQQIWLIARRSVVRTFRQPGTWIPPLTFPLTMSGTATVMSVIVVLA